MIAVLLLRGPCRAEQLEGTGLREVLAELETFSRRMEAVASGDPREAGESTLRILRSFEERLPELRRRAGDALRRLEERLEDESKRIDHDERRAAAAVEKLEALRRSLNARKNPEATRRTRGKRVRALTGRLVEGLLREKERQAAATLATLGERSRRSRALDRELAESRARLESFLRRLESALPRAVALLESTPVPPGAPATLGQAPRRLILALDRIQNTLLDVVAAHVVALEAVSAGPSPEDAAAGEPSKARDTASARTPDARPENTVRPRPAGPLLTDGRSPGSAERPDRAETPEE